MLIDLRIYWSWRLFLLGDFELKILAPYVSSFVWLIEGTLFAEFKLLLTRDLYYVLSSFELFFAVSIFLLKIYN